MTKKVKIEELTEEQKAQIQVYTDMWIKIGLDTRTCDRPKVETLAKVLYEQQGLVFPATVLWANSPWEALAMLKRDYKLEERTCFDNFCYGNNDANWLGFYDYFASVLNLTEECKPIMPLIALGRECGWFLPFDELICFVDRPEEINLLAGGKHYCFNSQEAEVVLNGVLHKDGGMALRYRDGKGVYALNGVRMPSDIVTTPWDKIPIEKVFNAQTNAEIRREIVRKIGIERVSEKAVTLDKQGSYELLGVDIGDGNVRPYLKMVNPSIGVYHVEGVEPNIRTVKDALMWRNGTAEEPVAIT